MQNGCISSDSLNLYLSGQLTDEQRTKINDHLNVCTACRGRLLAAGEEPEAEKIVPPPEWLVSKVASMPRAARLVSFNKSIWAGIAAIAAVLVVGLAVSLTFYERNPFRNSPADAFRNAPSASSRTPVLMSPTIQRGAIEFRWSRTAETENYLITILNETGNVIYRQDVKGESYVLNLKAVSFDHVKPYFWYVTAKSSHAVTADSKIGKFYPHKTQP
jgi:hypothetical protein